MNKIKNTDSGKLSLKSLQETNSDMLLLSLEKIIDSCEYSLCIDNNHKHFKDPNSKKYNTELIKLFKFLSQKTWNEIYSLRRKQEYGHEHLPIQDIKIQNIQSFFLKICNRKIDDKCDIFRFGGQKFRACGYRQGNVFYLVCIDYDFTLYNHGN